MCAFRPKLPPLSILIGLEEIFERQSGRDAKADELRERLAREMKAWREVRSTCE